MLNSLEIKNFRMLEDFKVAKLGRVNLIVGKNNSGKSTVLEALRIYAGTANNILLKEIADSHDEKIRFNDEEPTERGTDFAFADLFTGRQLPEDNKVQIVIAESVTSEQALSISHVFFMEKNETEIDEKGVTKLQKSREIISKSDIKSSVFPFKQALKVSTKNFSFYVEFNKKDMFYLLIESFNTPCSFVPTQLISMDELAGIWDNIVRTEYEEIITDALKIIIPEYEDLIFVANEHSNTTAKSRRIAKVKLANLPRPVPLKSLGDGMIRVLQLALKLVSAQGGFLLIDEFENGLHYSTQEKIWALLFKMAEKLDIQVFATTHSWDCIESFNKVALEHKDVGGVLFRMGKSVRTRDKGKIIATVFSEDELATMTQIDMEIR